MIRLAWTTTAAALLACPDAAAFAQGVTTSGIRVSLRAVNAASVEGARVRVTHTATGFAAEAEAREGRLLIQGLEPGGPYTITVRHLGFIAQAREQVFLGLGERLELEFVLQPMISELTPVLVIATRRPPHNPAHAHGGTATTISDSLLHRLPTLNRDLYDFVRLVPQVSTRIGLPNAGFSAGGVGFRFNNFLINGVSERTIGGSVSNAFSGAKSIPLDAVQEYQVLLAPYDVRYGDFTGALVNAVTKSGTNELHGSGFIYGRNDRLARRAALADGGHYDRVQYGFSLGGPIVRDRVHFFVAPELQRFTYPAPGPYSGQPQRSDPALPVSEADLTRLAAIMRRYGLAEGSAGPVENGNPLRNVFSRVDAAFPAWNSRAVMWNSYSASDDLGFSRASRDTFSLSTYQLTRVTQSRLSAIQLHTSLPRRGGGHNELLVSHRSASLDPVAEVHQPIVRVSLPGVTGGRVTANTGTHELAQSTWTKSSAVSIKEGLTLPVGTSHIISFGAEAEWFRIRRGGVPGSYGTWTFASLDDFELGVANRYEVGLDFGGPSVPLTGAQYAAYLGERWEAHRRLSITLGLRADMLALDGSPPYHGGVDSIFGRRTDQMPARRVELAPRIGFIWDISGTQRHQLRGGAGIFTARYPLAWAHSAASSHGVGGGLLRCGRASGDAGLPPSFNADHRAPPTACAGGSSTTANRRGDVDLLDRNLRMMRVARGSLAYELRLAASVRLAVEALVTRGLSDFVFENLNLAATARTDRNGRVMYGFIGPTGTATPDLRSGFSEVIDLKNTSRNRSYQLATRLEKDLTGRLAGAVSYTYSRVRDAQTPLRVNTRGTAAWASARVLSGRQDEFTPGISSNDIPHRVVLSGVYAIPRSRWSTQLSFYYVGEAGRPFTYVASGVLRRGDLNADGANANDPIYVPRNAFDSSEIRFDPSYNSVQLQQAAFESLVERTSCLRRQRGRILERNSCREPWSTTTIASVRQSVPLGGRALEIQLDIFNVLNLLNSGWGSRREAAPALLEHVGQTAGPVQASQSVFRFDTAAPRWTTLQAESAFQLQLALRYRF
ncbi:MAG: carboxypeptidase regulatory-like domain-containing protein [Gemmatimonadaceae bacterium]